MKKLFGGINLTWKRLIIFALAAGIYTAIMAIIPITDNTSFRDIAVTFEWWILFGIIIISNSKSPKDSALKCFVFFLISQPLIYLLQVPFSYMGWGLFKYYRYWFIWTLLTIPMGFIGYYIKKKNILSVIILLPMLIFLAYLGLGYLISAIESFPHHLLSFIACLTMIIVIVLSLFDKLKLRLLAFSITIIFIIGIIFFNIILVDNSFIKYEILDENLGNNLYVSSYSGTKQGDVQLMHNEDETRLKLIGQKGGEYTFTLTDEKGNEYSYKYYFDKENNTVILKEIK